MTHSNAFEFLQERNIALDIEGGELVVRAPEGVMNAETIALLRFHKQDLIKALRSGDPRLKGKGGKPVITPDLLSLVTLTQIEIDRIVAAVDGGAANVQDIYLLAPLQEGMLYHHLSAEAGDPYLGYSLMTFDSRWRLNDFLTALQAVIVRHDVLRTGVQWEGLAEPVQVVWREARLPVEEVVLDPALGSITEQLKAQFDPRHYRLDVRRAPLLAAKIAEDKAQGRWLLMLLSHHLVGDATSTQALIEEVQAYLRGDASALPTPVQYRNYVAQARLERNIESDEAFFRDMLGTLDEPTLPYGLADVQGDGGGIGEATLPIETDLGRRLRSQARSLGVSVASLFHLAWGRVLGGLSGRDDVVFGTVLLGRHSGVAERALGMFINTLPLRLTLEGSVAEAVGQAQRRLAGLLAHEHASLALAQRCSGVRAPLPLFSALLNYRHNAVDASDEASADSVGMTFLGGEERTNYPLTLSVDDRGEAGFSLTVQALLPLEPERVGGYVQTALTSLVTALESTPDLPVQSLEILPTAERTLLLDEWNATAAPYPSEQCIHELFEEQVQRSPDAVAVVHGEATLSYAQLNARANQLAHHLQELGVGPDDRVAICADRSLEMVVGLLGVLKAGGAYVPLDPAYPAERLAYMLEDSAPVAVLVHGDVPELATGDVSVIALDDTTPWLSCPESNLERGSLTPAHLAYVIYTSGSTGRPKGVMNHHRGLCNLATAQIELFAVGADSRVLQFASSSFDASVWEVVMALCSGAGLYLASREAIQPGEPLLTTLRRHAITHVTLPPSIVAGLGEDCPRLTLITAGEACPPGMARALAARHRYFNAYGPSETTVCATVHRGGPDQEDLLPIGRPIANARVYLLDAHGQPVPIGVVGEILVGGVSVARGYLNRPELTAERFVADPFSSEPNARLYRTGDLGRYQPDGNLEYLGRNDFQVKIRGFRIETGEIEACLLAHGEVKEAAVLAREDAAGDPRLVAYYAGEADAQALRAHLQAALPDYMVPAAFVALESLPLTSNGKLDRKALPAPDDDAYARAVWAAPAGSVEEMLAGIWQDLLGVERVGRHDNFFALGGHSLLILKLIDQLKENGVSATASDAFKYPSLAEMAENVCLNHEVPGHRALAIRSSGLSKPLFLVHDGLGIDLYIFGLSNHIDSDIPIYGLPAIPADEPQLRTLEELAARHVKMIRDVQPEGPYRVAGWCAGGFFAYEIATQLLGQDQQVEFIGLFDSKTPDILIPKGERSVNKLLLDFCGVYGRKNELVEAYSSFAMEFDFFELLATFRKMQALPKMLDHLTNEQIWQLFNRAHVITNAICTYSPFPVPLPLHLFVAKENETGIFEADEFLGWGTALPKQLIHRIEVPGNHESMVKEHAPALGEAINKVLMRSEITHVRNKEIAYQPLVRLQTGRGSENPVICVPGAGNSVISMLDFVSAIGPDRPVYGLQPRGLDGGDTVPHRTVEAAVNCYLDAVTDIVEQGPVHLLGHSFGGWIAFEMALRLQMAGRSVTSLMLVDCNPPVPLASYTRDDVLIELLDALELTSGQCLTSAKDAVKGKNSEEHLRILRQAMVDTGQIPASARPEIFQGVLRTFAAGLRASYCPSYRYEQPLYMVLCEDPRKDGLSNEKVFTKQIESWYEFAPTLKCLKGPGNHFSILRAPHVNDVFDWWKENCLS